MRRAQNGLMPTLIWIATLAVPPTAILIACAICLSRRSDPGRHYTRVSGKNVGS
jgi:hypothetical protein